MKQFQILLNIIRKNYKIENLLLKYNKPIYQLSINELKEFIENNALK